MSHLLQRLFAFFLFFLPFLTLHSQNTDNEFPILHNGRFRPAEAYSRLWLYDLYNKQSLKKDDLHLFHTQTPAALNLLLNLHLFGMEPWQSAPLFWIKSAELKQLAGLNLMQDRFSYRELTHAFYTHPISSKQIAHQLTTYEFLQAFLNPLNYAHKERFELKNVVPGLWLQLKQADLIVAAVPEESPWPFSKGELIAQNIRAESSSFVRKKKQLTETLMTLIANLRKFEQLQGQKTPLEEALKSRFEQLLQQNLPNKQIAASLEKEYPLIKRLNAAGSLLQALPSRYQGQWFSLHALKVSVYSPHENRLVPVGNFTLFSDAQFESIRTNYLAWENAALRSLESDKINALFHPFTLALTTAYEEIAGSPSKQAEGKALFYPSLFQLHFEALYYQYSWIEMLIFLYSLSAILLFCAYRLNNHNLSKWATRSLWLAFILHTALLILRSYILNRPPVSNMFETVIYVPWAGVLCGLMLNLVRHHLLVLLSAALTSIILLIILKLTDLSNGLDNVQAVLDSQFWLMIHVLMIVGSYGVFILGAIISHFYLILYLLNPIPTTQMRFLAQFILQTMYLGLVLLIPGTILGGVWAAESWGRFWDWDPKESWAFISICIYLIWVHAYRYGKIGTFGLAIGSISGLLAISFTWYGVNYILGTGLHSYGFGSGGEAFYYGFIGLELLFIILTLVVHQKRSKLKISY